MMETFALWGALGIFYGLYVYLNEEREWGLKLSLILYFLTCFVHERYMVLIVVIFLALAMKLERRIILWGLAVLDFLAVMAIRMATIGTLLSLIHILRETGRRTFGDFHLRKLEKCDVRGGDGAGAGNEGGGFKRPGRGMPGGICRRGHRGSGAGDV